MENEASLVLPKLYHTIVLCGTRHLPSFLPKPCFHARYFAWAVINAAVKFVSMTSFISLVESGTFAVYI